jgi:threonine dehydrogenase-like Zn-dependent dehydrogenase
VDKATISNVPILIRPTGSNKVRLALSKPEDYFLKEPSGGSSLMSAVEYDPSISSRTTAVIGAGEVGAAIVLAIVQKIATATVKPSSEDFIATTKRMQSELPNTLVSIANNTVVEELKSIFDGTTVAVANRFVGEFSYDWIWAKNVRYELLEDAVTKSGIIFEYGFFEIATTRGLGGSLGRIGMGIAIIDAKTNKVLGRIRLSDSSPISVNDDDPKYEEKVVVVFRELIKKIMKESIRTLIRN